MIYVEFKVSKTNRVYILINMDIQAHERNLKTLKNLLDLVQITDNEFERWFQSWIEPHLWYVDIGTDVETHNPPWARLYTKFISHVFPHVPQSDWGKHLDRYRRHYCRLNLPNDYLQRRHDHNDFSIQQRGGEAKISRKYTNIIMTIKYIKSKLPI